jgi:putative ABC transport system permease protein
MLPLLASAATVQTGERLAAIGTVLGRSWDPVFDGRYRLIAGHAPQADGEILATTGALRRLGISVGGTAHVTAPAEREVTVVGVLDARSMPASQEILFGTPESFGANPDLGTDPQAVVYLPDTPLTWTQVQALNAHGAIALSRTVAMNPPRSPSYDQTGYGDRSSATTTILMGSIIVGFALLEVMLLAGAAFMVGARAQERSLATFASVGAPRGALIGVITSSGVLLGGLGGLVGLAAGIGLGSLFMAATDDGSATRYWGYHLPVGTMVLIGVAAVVVGWAGALVPAIRASRIDVVQALRGARRPPRTGRRRPLIGLMCLIAGIGVTLAGGALLVTVTIQNRGTMGQLNWLLSGSLIGGPILSLLGLVLCSQRVLRTVARALGRFGVAARLAARDAARNPARSVPALAVIMTTVFVAVFGMSMIASWEATAASQYQYRLLPGQVGVAASAIDSRNGVHKPVDADALAQAVRSSLDTDMVRVLSSVSDPVTITASAASGGPAVAPGTLLPSLTVPAENQCPSELNSVNYDERTSDRASAEARAAAADWRCRDPFVLWGGIWGNAGHIWVGDADDLALMIGHTPSAAERTALNNGEAVTFYPHYLRNGTVNISWWPAKHWDNTQPFDAAARASKTKTLPAVKVSPAHGLPYGILISRPTADTLGLSYSSSIVIASPRTPPTQAQLDALNGRISAVTGVPDSYAAYVENGPPHVASGLAWALVGLSALIAVAAASIAIALARADGRRDQVTLAAIGASPSVRRGFGFWQAIVLAGVGAILGALTGLVPAIALTLPGSGTEFTAPWPQIAVAATVLPLAIACVTWLTPTQVTIDIRRTAIE